MTRAERCIGLAIRKGQAEGKIAKRGQGGGKAPNANRDRVDKGICLPSQIVSGSELSANKAGIYHMTDNVTDAAFDAAIGEATR